MLAGMVRPLKFLIMMACVTLLAACAMKPPIQEMAEARSAVEMAQQIEDKSLRGIKTLKSAEQSLQEAADAIDAKHYETARRKAVEAKRKAQLAVKLK